MKNIAVILGFTPTLYVDDGHGMETAGKRTPALPDGSVIRENEFNRPTADKLEALAKAVGFRVVQSAPEISDPGLTARSTRINSDYSKQRTANPKITWDQVAVGVSIHFNAFDGIMDSAGRKGGVDVFYNDGSTPGKKLAGIVLNHLVGGTDQANRGIKNNNLHMTRETYPPFILCECGFMDILKEAQLMKQEAFQLKCATEILAGVCEYYGQNLQDLMKEPVAGRLILQKPKATVGQCQAWAKAKGATQEFIDLAPIFYKLADPIGVDAAGAFAQSAKETGYGKFGGVLDATYKNPCGMKKTAGGGNYDPEAHQRFKDWAEGIQAHIDHLALYAGAAGYPLSSTPDPRHFIWIKGKAPLWSDLGGKWAPSATYGTDIVKMLEAIEATAQPVPETKLDATVALKAEIDSLNRALSAMTARTVEAEALVRRIHSITAPKE